MTPGGPLIPGRPGAPIEPAGPAKIGGFSCPSVKKMDHRTLPGGPGLPVGPATPCKPGAPFRPSCPGTPIRPIGPGAPGILGTFSKRERVRFNLLIFDLRVHVFSLYSSTRSCSSSLIFVILLFSSTCSCFVCLRADIKEITCVSSERSCG